MTPKRAAAQRAAYGLAFACCAAAGAVFGAEIETSGFNLPDYLIGAVIAGTIQGLIWYGATNAKISSLTDRIRTIENNRVIDHQQQETRYQHLIKILIDENRAVNQAKRQG